MSGINDLLRFSLFFELVDCLLLLTKVIHRSNHMYELKTFWYGLEETQPRKVLRGSQRDSFLVHPSKSGLKLVCNVYILSGNLRFENSQDYVQKPQRNCMFMNSASDDIGKLYCVLSARDWGGGGGGGAQV